MTTGESIIWPIKGLTIVGGFRTDQKGRLMASDVHGPLPIAAGVAHEPFRFDEYPDDAETLSKFGMDSYGSTEVVVTVHDQSVRVTVKLLGSTVTMDLTPAVARRLAGALSDVATDAAAVGIGPDTAVSNREAS